MKRGTFSPREYSRYIDRIMATFPREKISQLPRSSNNPKLPIFVVGMPRSGTTLVEQILASHPEVAAAGELPDIMRLAQTLPQTLQTNVPYPESINGISQELLERLAGDYMATLRKVSAFASRIVDKMPHNFLHLGLIELLFPDARVTHIRRSALDTCLSCYFQEFSIGHSYTYNLDHLGMYYRDHDRLMRHWIAHLQIPMLQIQYEELVRDQEAVTRLMLDF